MIVATTPTLRLTLPDTIDLTEADQVYVTLAENKTVITKVLGDGMILADKNIIEVYLSQEDTLQFKNNSMANVQVNWTFGNSSRHATKIKRISISPNLIPEVI